jgi:hypothetical protein
LLCYPINHAAQLPDRGISQIVIFFPVREAC